MSACEGSQHARGSGPRRKREAFSLGPATRADRPALAPTVCPRSGRRLGPVTVHVLHENPEWMPPFAAAFAAEGVDWDETLVTGGSLDLTAAPAEGLWWSRMSASAHTRGHTAAAEHARALLDVLEAHGRRVVNGRAVLDLELSKVRQLALLRAARIAVPRSEEHTSELQSPVHLVCR